MDSTVNKNIDLSEILAKLNKAIESCENSEKRAEKQNMEYIMLTSGAMAQAYRNVRSWLSTKENK